MTDELTKTSAGIGNAKANESVRVVRPTRTSSVTRSRTLLVVEVSAVMLAPIVLFFLLGAEPYFLQNALDPQIYMGFAAEPNELFARFGNTTYYAVRFGLLWPMELTTKLFGVTGGYFFMRWGLAVLGGGCMYWALRRLATRPIAAAGALFFITSPVTLRALMTAYSDTTSLMYLGAAASLLIAARTVKQRTVLLVVVGLLLGLAIHSNPFNLLICAVLMGSWAIVELRSRRQMILTDLTLIGGAVVAVTLVGMLVYQVRFGSWNLFTPTLLAFKSVTGSTGNAFRSPTVEWTKYQLQLYLPLLMLTVFTAANCRSLRKIRPWEATSALMVGGVFSALCAEQFLGGGTSLETFYYSSCLAPFEALLLAATLNSLWRMATFATYAKWAMVSLIVLTPLALNAFTPLLEIDRFPAIPFMILFTSGLAIIGAQLSVSAHARGRSAKLVAGLAAGLLLISTSLILNAPPRLEPRGTLFNPHYENALGNPERTGLDIYRLSFDMVAAVPPLISEGGLVLIWNNPAADPFAGTLAGPFIGQASQFQSTGAGLPDVTDWLLSRIPYENIDTLVLLDRDQSVIQEGVAALKARGVKILDVKSLSISSGDYRYFLEILDVEP